MFVYGVRAAPADLPTLPQSPAGTADYYMDYGLLVFPSYTRPTCLQAHGGRLTPTFWESVARVVSQPMTPHEVDREQPFIEEEEAALVAALKKSYPGTASAWYYVPRAVWTPPSELPAIQVLDLS